MLPMADRIAYVNHYTHGTADPADPRLSPLRAASLADLPPALVITAEHDPLREEARRYAQRLRAEGTPARYTDYVGMTHGFLSFPGLAGGARQALAEMCQELADMFRTSSR
jgi:acetyl esterase